jgi:hypothetical protein
MPPRPAYRRRHPVEAMRSKEAGDAERQRTFEVTPVVRTRSTRSTAVPGSRRDRDPTVHRRSAGGGIGRLADVLSAGPVRDVRGPPRVDGSIDGRSGTFVMHADGSHDGTGSDGKWTVVPGSGPAVWSGSPVRGRSMRPADNRHVRPRVSVRLSLNRGRTCSARPRLDRSDLTVHAATT